MASYQTLPIAVFFSFQQMKIAAPAQRIINGGRLVITSGIKTWMDTGLEPFADEPNPSTLSKDWRQHYVSVILTSHLSGDAGDTCSEDAALNAETFANPGGGGRIVTLWHRNSASKIFCITDNYGSANAVTT